MSLNFDLSRIPEDVRTVIATEDDAFNGIKKGDRLMSPVTNTLIWTTMIVGIGVIDDRTIDEFVARVELHQKLHGALMSSFEDGKWSDRPLTREDIEAHKGLSTNVFPMETRTKWVTRTVTKDTQVFPKPEPKVK